MVEQPDNAKAAAVTTVKKDDLTVMLARVASGFASRAQPLHASQLLFSHELANEINAGFESDALNLLQLW